MSRFLETSTRSCRRAGFTLIEVLIASLIMIIIVVGALSIYVKSNKTAADQQQYVQIQQDVRAGIYYLSRDVRMAGAGLPSNFMRAAIFGTDNESQGGTVQPDRIELMGNLNEAMSITIQNCQAHGIKVNLNDNSLEQLPYPDDYYIGQIVLIFPNSTSSCWGVAIREITDVKNHHGGTNEEFTFHPSKARDINPKSGLRDVCSDADYTGGLVMFGNVMEYWLDVTGNYPGLTAGVNGYIGGGTGGVLYQTNNNIHNPLAMNIEDFQVQYNGNFDNDASGTLDGFTDWNNSWSAAQIASIRQVKLWVVGRTPTRFVSISAGQITGGSLYRRPAIANSPGDTTDDGRKRFVLETTVNIRNMSLGLYNTGIR